MHDASHSSRTPAGGRSTFILLVVVLLPVLYVLSLGPIVRLSSQEKLGPDDSLLVESLVILYSPLLWCLKYEIPGLAPALLWYISLWTG